MANQENKNTGLENGNERKDQEQLNQKALGNDDIQPKPENNNDLLNTPKTTGTGSNPAGARPDSLIVHEDEEGDKRYEKGE
ncbi:hypothetical protein DHW03_05565 [Pedobacter yonginense]|uniref:Uncharacterized protein n=1 Tax=Pedobacter yonginense TaxID=651869 RepID=A0A317EVN7_9SPHI|nr:hypothetical protein [Pedobacter yonginense]PWS29286.1 hypothetical protein DHW03_05565 [Pedobacter yonginense]